MTVNEAVDVIIGILQELHDPQEQSCRPYSEITPDCCPIYDLPGFDSLSGLEVTMELEDKLGLELIEDGKNILVSEDKNKPLTIKESAELICKLMNSYKE